MVATEQVTEQPAEFLARLGKNANLVPYGGGNFGMPLDLLDDELIVPVERFFTRSNGPVPTLDPAAWRLHVRGTVRQPLSLSLGELKALAPVRSLTAFLECAGNGRTRFHPVPEGTPWRNDAAGNATWEGVPLAAVLDLAGVREETVDLITAGGDFPGMQRGLPLAVARDSDTLLVWGMNGADLTVAHGAPVRLLVPGWAGIASTKWLIGIEALDHAYAGFWNTDNYVFWSEAGEPLRPVTQMPVKSVIQRPLAGAELNSGCYEITGYAWSGYGAIQQVEVSTDGGERWRPAALEGAGRRAWFRFRLGWDAAPGPARILARATDERGLRQPVAAEWNAKGYLMNGIHAVDVLVRG